MQHQIVREFHTRYAFTGPTKADLAHKLPVALVWNKVKQEELERQLCLMWYTPDGEGCRLLDRDEGGRETLIKPGRNTRQTGTATTAIEAAEANKFYPHQEYKIMEVNT